MRFTFVREALFDTVTDSFKSPYINFREQFILQKQIYKSEKCSVFFLVLLPHRQTSVQGLANSGERAISFHSEHDRFYPLAYTNAIFEGLCFITIR